jgi:sortase A
VRRRLTATANALFALGLVTLSVPAAHYATGLLAQNAEPAIRCERPEEPQVVPAGQAWGRIEIPRLGIDLVVFQGIDDATLRKGPGHLPGTATPGRDATGNCVIAGHRDSFFRGLAHARPGDLVRVRGSDGSAASYRLESRRVVSPQETSVVASTTDRRLTLLTCYPFGWIGPAPYRLVWTASAVSSTAPASRPSRAGR